MSLSSLWGFSIFMKEAMPIDLKAQNFGVEIEMTGLTRRDAAYALAELWQSRPAHIGAGYDTRTTDDEQGKTWKLSFNLLYCPHLNLLGEIWK